MDFPKLKKRVSNFFLGEEGRISKSSLLGMGTLFGIVSLSGFVSGGSTSYNHASGACHSNGHCSVNYVRCNAINANSHSNCSAASDPKMNGNIINKDSYTKDQWKSNGCHANMQLSYDHDNCGSEHANVGTTSSTCKILGYNHDNSLVLRKPLTNIIAQHTHSMHTFEKTYTTTQMGCNDD